jgi:hypothetical protein
MNVTFASRPLTIHLMTCKLAAWNMTLPDIACMLYIFAFFGNINIVRWFNDIEWWCRLRCLLTAFNRFYVYFCETYNQTYILVAKRSYH